MFSALLLAIGLPNAVQAPSSVLYAPGRSLNDQQISLRSWGSGTIAETDEVALEGRTSVRVSTRNLFQGGSIILGRPQDLADEFDNKHNLLRLTFLIADKNLTLSGGGTPQPGRSSVPGNLPPGVELTPEMEEALRGRLPGRSGAPNQNPRPGASSTTKPSVREMRLIITTTDGKKSEAYVPIGTSSSVERGWRRVAIPLQAIRGFDRTNKTVKEIAVSADATTSMYIGDIRVVSDATPITGEVNARSLNLALGDEVTLTATGYGGSSVLVYQWDFDAQDGIQVDAEGQVVNRKFRKPGSYTVTLTISDLYGLKEPFRSTFQAKVNP